MKKLKKASILVPVKISMGIMKIFSVIPKSLNTNKRKTKFNAIDIDINTIVNTFQLFRFSGFDWAFKIQSTHIL
ncbi:hypothetical protein GENT5_17270 [Flavobacterium ammoniigenes]|jgi:hypothetical protein|uniref:Uncharacterized protein n=1 Tax=Flavobacterium ammoniigenes TaxID=1751095 RepID=A0ABM7V778_9FLAO|nr:hypothetical protein [Flavobacterium ammoniigenes]BDB55422.1 hypothetical protein GENT5_17270 [Flavobacterium ammoniigenes]